VRRWPLKFLKPFGPLLAGPLLAVPPLLAAMVVLHACGGGGGGAPPSTPSGPPFGLTARVALGSALTFPNTLPNPNPLTAVRAFPSLSFSRPVFLAAAPDGTDRVFVVEQDGRVLVFPNRDNVATTEVRTFLDLRAAVGGPVSRAGNEEGLLGLAFDPQYATNRTFYIHYSAANPRRSVFARYQAQATNPNAADLTSAQVILTVAQPYDNHNGGWLGFGPDGYLYVALGDGGAGDDPQQHAQNMNDLLGKILRLDVSGQATYVIPSDNPFVGQAGRRGEIWCAGMRNPWRCSFDRNTGELWAGDVGQGQREEIDKIRRGGNYGWRIFEGTRSNINPLFLPASDFDAPVRDYPRSDGTTVIGGYVYRGPTLPSVRGAYIHGDYGSGNVWALVHDGTQTVSNTLVSGVSGLVSFGEDRFGELFAVSLNGGIYRFSDAGGGGGGTPYPARLSLTGLFSNTTTLTPHAGLVPFDVTSPLWSDGAFKRRWIALPDGARIAFSETGAWTFPVGTVLVKHFELELTSGDPSSRTRLETRVLVHEAAGWAGTTYRWNAAQTDADLLVGGEDAVYTIQDSQAPGGQRDLTWHFPSRTDCQRCHTVASGSILGVRTGQLNRDLDYGTVNPVTDNQLRSWNHIGLFTSDIGAPANHEAWPSPSDATASMTGRARSYLAANCAQCHLPGGPAPGGLDLRWNTLRAAMNVIDVRPTNGDLGLSDPWRVRPSNRASSVLYLRMTLLDPTRMPPLAHESIDPVGTAAVGAWIDVGAP